MRQRLAERQPTTYSSSLSASHVAARLLDAVLLHRLAGAWRGTLTLTRAQNMSLC
jgi:hypothetical protein